MIMSSRPTNRDDYFFMRNVSSITPKMEISLSIPCGIKKRHSKSGELKQKDEIYWLTYDLYHLIKQDDFLFLI